MGIISKTSDGVVKQPKPFPKLMISKNLSAVIVFINPNSGTVLIEGNGPHRVGHYSKEWILSCFEDYEGTVSLSNE